MTVTRISSSRSSSHAAPKMMFASGFAASMTMFAAVSTSSSPSSEEPVMLMRTPVAPLMDVSSSGLETAAIAACSALSRPEAVPTPMCAWPASFMMAETSAKSRLMITCSEYATSSEMELTACFKTSSAIPKALAKVIFWSVTNFRRSFGMIIRESTLSERFAMPPSACRIRFAPSNLKGFVTTPTVKMPLSCANCAIMGAAPVPVPPPIPAVIKTMSVSSSTCAIAFLDSSADFWPISGLEPAPMPPVSFSPIWILFLQVDLFRSCLSVLIATNSTPCTPDAIILLITLLPAPPTPMTLILTTFSVKSAICLPPM